LKSKGAAHRARFRIGSWKGKRYRHILSGIGTDAHRSHNLKDLFAPKGACLSSKLAARADCRFQLNKRSQLFIRSHNKMFSVGRLWYGEPNAIGNAIEYAKFFSRSHTAVIRVYDGRWQRDRNARTRGRLQRIKEPLVFSRDVFLLIALYP
jgi:hypothetical protein